MIIGNLPPFKVGDTVRVKPEYAELIGVPVEGWWVDDVRLTANGTWHCWCEHDDEREYVMFWYNEIERATE